MKLQIFLEDVGRPVAYYPKLAKFLGSVNAAIFLCQFIYWKGKEKIENEFFKTAEEIEQETGLTYEQQKTARKILKEKGYLTEELKGIPAKIHYSFNWEKISQDWQLFIEKEHKKENCKVAPNKIEGNPQTSMRETRELVQGNPSNYIHRLQHRLHRDYINNSNSTVLNSLNSANTIKNSNEVICWSCNKVKDKKDCLQSSPDSFICKKCFFKKKMTATGKKQVKQQKTIEKALKNEEKLYKIENQPVFSNEEKSEMAVEISKEERKEKRKGEKQTKGQKNKEELDIWEIPY